VLVSRARFQPVDGAARLNASRSVQPDRWARCWRARESVAMAWFRVDRDGPPDPMVPSLSARECAAASVWRGKVLITNGNDAHNRFKDLIEFDPREASQN